MTDTERMIRMALMTGEQYLKSIEELKNKHLILIIAHRLSTIENADKIAILDKGKIIDIGTDKELTQRCELYQKFKAKDKSVDF